MEKKGSRCSVQSSSKGLATDVSKKSQDASNGKQWPRGSRRREPPGLGPSSKPEPSRKPTPQRSKTIVDKRPRPRGSSYYGGAACGKEDAELMEPECAELGSVFVQGSKKQSLNHLLNFHYAPREARPHAVSGEKTGHRWLGTQKHKYNKEQFLQANCQFVVNACGDYKQYMNNPDALVNWDLIEQVNVQVSEYPSCPICLYPPVAAKMTRCGHIYCWSCILHYLALSDKIWRKCPICYEAVHKQDLKSVVSFLHPPLNVNDTITFKLMKRLRGSLLAYPIDHDVPAEENALYNMREIDSNGVYSKLVLADRSQVMAIIERESAELHAQLSEDEDCPEKCFIEQAITLLKDREGFVLESRIAEGVRGLSVVEEEAAKIEEGGEEATGGEPESIGVEDLDVSQQPVKYHYFYQASDGQHIYVHAVNVRMLEHTYGSLEQSPRIIVGKIVEKEGGSMTEELRKRLRYLQHLPVTCQFEVAEILLKPPFVSKETVDHFKEQLDTRRKRRQRKARDEKRREKRIAEEENKKMGKYPAPIIHIESHQHFPEFGPDVASHQRTESESTPRSERSLSPVSTASNRTSDAQSCAGSVTNETGCLSFAKMLSSAAKPRAGAWPQVNKAASEPARVINVTGAKASTSFAAKARNQSESESDLEGYVPVPTFNQSFGDAIALALEKAALASDCRGGGEQEGGKKKKKKKQKVLFATSMVYSGN